MRFTPEKVHHCRSGFFWNKFASHGAHGGPKDADAQFKDQEGNVDRKLVAWKRNWHEKWERGNKEDGTHERFNGEFVWEKLENCRPDHHAQHEAGEDNAVRYCVKIVLAGKGRRPFQHLARKLRKNTIRHENQIFLLLQHIEQTDLYNSKYQLPTTNISHKEENAQVPKTKHK